MNDLLPFVVSGIAIGAVYGLTGTGLVLTYKTSGIFNFGHGALATAAAYLFYWLHVDQKVGWEISAVIAVLVAGPLMGLGMELVSRRLAPQRNAMKIVGTIGLILLVQGLGTIKYGPDSINVPNFLPGGSHGFELGGTHVRYKYVFVAAIAVVLVAALYALFRFTRIGLAMRAVVDDPALLDLLGTNPARVRRAAWITGSTLAALSGVLVLPLVGLEPIFLTFLVVEALGAAAFGGFSNIPLTFLGGIVIGVGSDITKNYVVDVTWLGGLPPSLPFVALFVILLVLPRRRLLPPTRHEVRPRLQRHAPARVRAGTGALVLVPLLLVPTFAGSDLTFYTVGLTQVVMLLSLGLLVRTSGQVSLCHSAFAAIGAVVFSQFAVDHHLPWLLAALLAALVVVPVGALLALPAIRLSGLFLALATLAFGIMIERLFYAQGFMFTPTGSGRTMPRPSFASGDNAYYYLVLGFVVVVSLLMVAVHQARLGRVLRGMSESPVAVSTLGQSTKVTRMIVFCISAFVAGLSGILYGTTVGSASTTDVHFSSFNSVVLLAILALAPFGEPWYALFAGLVAIIPAYIPGSNTPYVLNAIFGISAVAVAMQGGTPGMPPRLRAALERLGQPRGRLVPAAAGAGSAVTVPVAPVPATEPRAESRATDAGAAETAGSDITASEPEAEASEPEATASEPEAEATETATGAGRSAGDRGLRVEDLTVRFGGLVAVRDLTLLAPPGQITGLIGPNGAGKTTTFNACTGLNRPTSGRVLFGERDISHASQATRGRAGIGRTFQIMELAESLTVAENVALGRECGLAGAGVLSQLLARPTEARDTATATAAALELCGITDIADRQVGGLSTGQRRLVELARCLAGPFTMLLLDEPSSGLDRTETEAFAEVLERVVADRGIGILLVEHDMALVMRICRYIYVLDFGELLFEGDPGAVRASERVRTAYLGAGAEQSAPAGSSDTGPDGSRPDGDPPLVAAAAEPEPAVAQATSARETP
ncbi:Amino acid/amide ABC transporter membrane protein [Frankia canadensis]|uniref:Amino acid/amide ABC transporter membrane protein n=1 Tax=Frankia canadensis TaxID=1836972 RepID=A0A2I2KMB6_9ACTN|nr:ATP-binding cassette domain-containing protein [Frankia canadensis]SNQ46808.1 Amino acid/amide ABC transporter membrane protein [Frankia canadensis]SOU54098.1 Amino acid/amide ABC transporter membrane protein [Frankia canadensis]